MIKYSNSIDIESLNYRVKIAPEELVSLAERNYYQQLKQVVNIVSYMERKPHFLLLAGPSASSKTTTAHKLRRELTSAGITARVISLDDFYVNHNHLPKLKSGDVDYETINTLDLNCLNNCLDQLIKEHHADFPVFDFSTGCRSKKANPVTIDEHTVLIIEGLHALNPIITNDFSSSEFLNLYISPTSDYYMGNKLLISAREIRLMRRIIRDHFHRSSPIGRTLEMWVNVVISEVDSIMPFEKEADFVIDSTIIYEPCIYANHLTEIIGNANSVGDIFKPQMLNLKSAMENFHKLDKKYIPHDTVIHEFLD